MSSYQAHPTPSWLIWLAEESLPAVGLRLLLGYSPNFNGRATRRELAATVTIVAAVGLILSSLYQLYVARLGSGYGNSALAHLLPLGQAVILGLPLLSAAVRRLHDVNRSAWALGVIIIPYVGPVWLLGLLAWDGEPHENAFGPNPRPPAKDKV